MSEFILTLDMDWAPDWMLEDILRTLVDRRVAATWFVTHDTPVLAEILRRSDLFEAGIHPNCLQGTNHGATEQEVLETMFLLLPQAVSMRTHGLYQSTSFLALAASMGVRTDVSLFLPWANHLSPHVLPFADAPLVRLPYFWEDDAALETPGAPWSLDDPAFHGPGLRIFDFHPVHVALNTHHMAQYEQLKARVPLQFWTRDMVAEQISREPGPATLFDELSIFLRSKGATIHALSAQGGQR